MANKDFEIAEQVRANRQHEQDTKDFNAEQAGQTSGKIPRFGFQNNHDAELSKKKREREKNFTDLITAITYETAWAAAKEAYNTALTAVYDALTKASDDLSMARKDHQTQLDKTNSLPNGQKVFCDKHGDFYTQDGQKLTEEQLALLDEQARNYGSWENYDESQEKLKQAKDRLEFVKAKEARVAEINEQMDALDGKKDPDSVEEVLRLTDELNDITESVNKNQISHAFEADSIRPIHVPELKI